MTTKRIFAVGSKNPVKISCVAEAVKEFHEFWPDAAIVGAHTDSGVSRQPMSDHETFSGALTRAREALGKIPEAQFGVGIEGGALDTEQGMWAYAWVVVLDREKDSAKGPLNDHPNGHSARIGKGQTGRFLLPDAVARLVREGMELGDADDHFFGRENSKQKEGAIGILSDGRITRMTLYKPAVIFALLQFIHPEYYLA
jgi:inosine/xanthosine triphosphatase